MTDLIYQPRPLPVVSDGSVSIAVCRIERNSSPDQRHSRQADAVRRLLCYLSIDPALYRHDSHGAPFIDGSPLSVSVSHSRDYAVVAVSDRSGLGIDIEQLRAEQLQRVATRFLSGSEREILAPPRRLLWAWAAKEAVYKAAAQPGLSGPEIELDTVTCGTARVGNRSFRLFTADTPEYCCVVALRNPTRYD